MILFKFPYDFDDTNISKLTEMVSQYNQDEENIGISTVYFSAFKDHCMNARDESENNCIPTTWDDYVRHISLIKESGYEPDVLFQEPGLVLDRSIIQMYLDAGVRTFTVNDDRNAKIIKELCPEAYIVASITKILSPEDIRNKDLSVYDEICLYFWYSRNLKTLMTLPKTYKYSIIVNSWCSCTCISSQKHWFGNNRNKFICPEGYKKDGCGISDLNYFEPYIYTFKIQGRDCMDMAFKTFEYFLKRAAHIDTSEEFLYEHYYELGSPFPEVPLFIKKEDS